jgi:hypothetical protein
MAGMMPSATNPWLNFRAFCIFHGQCVTSVIRLNGKPTVQIYQFQYPLQSFMKINQFDQLDICYLWAILTLFALINGHCFECFAASALYGIDVDDALEISE